MGALAGHDGQRLGELVGRGSSYAARCAFGWRLSDLFYVDPEAQALGDGSYRELRMECKRPPGARARSKGPRD